MTAINGPIESPILLCSGRLPDDSWHHFPDILTGTMHIAQGRAPLSWACQMPGTQCGRMPRWPARTGTQASLWLDTDHGATPG